MKKFLYDLEQKQESNHEVSITSVSYQSINSDLISADIESNLIDNFSSGKHNFCSEYFFRMKI